MQTLKNRAARLEKMIAAAVPKRPVPFYILHAVGDPRRAVDIAAIGARVKTEQRFITYEIV